MTFKIGSAVHVCSQKEMFNSLVTKEEETVKIVDGSALARFRGHGTGTVNSTGRDGTVHALETVR